ncbi:DUF1345 domain-containing protein [Hymenobacter glacialis]|uniref:DUF1345 domain-containing protein n=1 Tax=Hymenobacter glacialis TaxID=1908236 RepID=UPI0013017103|nr:DUF1345 domain-containing protein [Hymenobacter glacialis]
MAHRLGSITAKYRLLTGLALGAVAWTIAPAGIDTTSRWVAIWDVYAGTTLLLIAAAVFTADAATIRKVANSEDLGRVLAFVFVLVAAVASLLGVVALLGTLDNLPRAPSCSTWP